MFDRNFILVRRVLDDTPMFVRINDIEMICVNADDKGPQDGVSAIYCRGGLALAVNATPEEIAEQIRSKELTQ